MYIEDFTKVITPHIKPYSLLQYSCKKLLAAGENYGSVMLNVEVVLKKEKEEQEILNIVAKLPPPKGFIWTLFTTTVTFKKEIDYYEKVAPTLENFMKSLDLPNYINSTPKYYGSRITLKCDSDVIDENALLLLENLKTQGYELGDRFTGFDLKDAKTIIDVMAKNHAVAIAFREAYPLEFNEHVLPPVNLKYKLEITEEYANKIVKSYIDFLQRFDINFGSYRQKMVNNFFYRVKMHSKPADDNIFNTIIHNDMWTNNMLVKVINGQITDVKLIDYQVICYYPGSNDLIFFLYTSVQLPILKEHTDELIQYYYESFITALTETKTDTSEFTWESFEKTIKPESHRQFSHIVKLICPIFIKKGKAKELEDFSPEDFAPNLDNAHENLAPRLEYIISDFIKRDWL